jgi:hypothetical protein
MMFSVVNSARWDGEGDKKSHNILGKWQYWSEVTVTFTHRVLRKVRDEGWVKDFEGKSQWEIGWA